MKSMKNIKYLSIALLLCGFAVNGTRGALTQDQSIASEVTNNPDATIAESSVQNQQDIGSKVSEQPSTVNVGTTTKVVQNAAQAKDAELVKVEEQPKSEVVYDNLTTDTEKPVATPEINIEGENGEAKEEIKNESLSTDLAKTDLVATETPKPVIDETQKTFAQEAEEKAEDKLAEEPVVAKQEVTEEEMVFNPEEKNVEQNIADKTEKIKNKSVANDILDEEKDKEEKLLEDQGGNSSYIEEDEVETEANEPQDIEVENQDAQHLIG